MDAGPVPEDILGHWVEGELPGQEVGPRKIGTIFTILSAQDKKALSYVQCGEAL